MPDDLKGLRNHMCHSEHTQATYYTLLNTEVESFETARRIRQMWQTRPDTPSEPSSASVVATDLPADPPAPGGDCPLPTPTEIAPVPAPSEPVASGSGVNFKRRKDVVSPYQVQILQEVFAEHINQNSIKIADIRVF